MKRFSDARLAAGLFCLVLATNGFSQISIRKAVRFGYTWSNFTNEYPYDQQKLKTWTAGAGLEIKLLGTFAVEGGVMYSVNGTMAVLQPKAMEVRLNSIAIPVIAKFSFFPVLIHPYVLGGVEVATLLSAKQDGEDIKDKVSTRDNAWILGCGAELSFLSKGVFIEGRMHFGDKDVFKDPGFKSVRNRTSKVMLGILF